MDDKGANIDLVFRNGLKDYEVLPPPDVWDSIHPVVKTKQRKVIIIRAAALIAIALTMSFLAYRYTREVSAVLNNEVMALNEGTVSPPKLPVIVRTLPVAVNSDKVITGQVNSLTISKQNLNAMSENDNSTLAVVYNGQESVNIPVNNSKPVHGPILESTTLSKSKTFKINESDLQYLPADYNKKGNERWSIAAMASPTYLSRYNAGNDELSTQLMKSEKPLISYTGGVAFSYKVNKRFTVQSGLYYSSLGQMIDGINSFGGFKKYGDAKGTRNFEVLTSVGTVYTNNPDVFLIADGELPKVMTNYTNDVFDPKKASLQYINSTIRQNFSYLEFPIIMRYKIIDKVIDFNLIGGVSTNVLVNNSVFTMVDGSKYSIGKTEGLNLITISSSLGMGMEYNISDNFSLNIEPTFRYYLNAFNGITGSKIHPYSFGIFSGVSYKF